MRLSSFITTHLEQILEAWKRDAADRVPPAEPATVAPLRDHLGELLEAIARDLDVARRTTQDVDRASPRDSWENVKAVGAKHGAGRAHQGMRLNQMIMEFPALRSCVTRLWSASVPAASSAHLEDLIRFDQALDLALTKSVSEFMDHLNRSRETFLGILGHDLRDPLSTIITAGRLMGEEDFDRAKVRDVAGRIVTTGERMHQLVIDLLDFTRTRFGRQMPIQRRESDLGQVVERVVGEFTTSHPRRTVHVNRGGDLHGNWDERRMSQAVANLLGNAVDHSSDDSSIEVSTSGKDAEVAIAVHNDGPAIPRERREHLFEPFNAVRTSEEARRNRKHLGLGLYIAKAIVTGHNGHIDVDSSDERGTTFTIRLPRRSE